MGAPRKPNTAEAESVARQLREAVTDFKDANRELARGLVEFGDRLESQLNRLEELTKSLNHNHGEKK